MVKKLELLDVSLGMLRITGVHPNQKLIYASAVICNNFLRIICLYLTVRLITASQGDLTVVMEGLEAFTGYVQGIPKISVLLMNRDLLQILIRDIDVLGHKNTDVPSFAFWLKAMKFYRSFIFVALGYLFAVALVTRATPFPCHVPDFSYAFPMVMVCQFVVIVIDGIYMTGADIFFVSVCLIIRQNFLELADDFTKMSKETNMERLKHRYNKCVNDHDALLHYSAHLASAFSICLLFQYLVTTFSICNELYTLTETEGTLVVKGMLLVSAALFQLSLYCFGAEEVTHFASQVSYFAYNVEWYNHPTSLQKYVPLITQRCQKPINFIAGGLVVINRGALTTIIKGSFSFYTLVKNMKELQN